MNGKKQNNRVTDFFEEIENRSREWLRQFAFAKQNKVMCLFTYWYDWSLPIYLVK